MRISVSPSTRGARSRQKSLSIDFQDAFRDAKPFPGRNIPVLVLVFQLTGLDASALFMLAFSGLRRRLLLQLYLTGADDALTLGDTICLSSGQSRCARARDEQTHQSNQTRFFHIRQHDRPFRIIIFSMRLL